MSIEHASRSGKIYYLHGKPGKSGKPNLYFSMDPDGPRVEVIPDGFEIHENIRGQVFLRRIPKKLITDAELRLVRTALNAHAEEWLYKIEVKKNTITIHETENRVAFLDAFPFPIDPAREKRFQIQNAHYMAVLRFILIDSTKRSFAAERFCFRGSIDDWISLDSPATLPTLLKRYVKHLGKDSFYNLPWL